MEKAEPTRPPTMKDVAKLAGVSQTTVSFVLNDRADMRISEQTQERVWQAARQLGYRPHAAAQSLRTSQSHLIGFISDEIATTPYAVEIIEGAQDAAWASGKMLLLVNTGGNEEVKETAVEMMLGRRVESIIYATMYHRITNPPAALGEAPAVLVDCYVKDRSLPSVVPDEVGGGRRATEFLLQKGHRRIGFINNVDPIPATFGRLEGCKQALVACDVPFDEDLVCAGLSNAESGYRCAQELMQLPDPPTAIFCFNDRVAMGTYDALRKLGRSIPGDVAVMGFDNQQDIAANLYPPLTTMALPHYEMGQWAVHYLLGRIESPDQVDPVQHRLECRLVERGSV